MGGAAQGKAVYYEGQKLVRKQSVHIFTLKDSCIFIIKEDKRNLYGAPYLGTGNWCHLSLEEGEEAGEVRINI